MRGIPITSQRTSSASAGTSATRYAVTTTRTHGFSSSTRGSRSRGFTTERRIGLMRDEDVRHAGEVAQDVVAVEAQQRQQLLEQQDVLHERGEQRRLLARGGVHAAAQQREQRVEVDAAEVGPQPPGAVEAVGVGDVAVEGGPDEVDADAHARRGERRRSGTRSRGRARGRRWRSPRSRARPAAARARRARCAGRRRCRGCRTARRRTRRRRAAAGPARPARAAR